MTPGFTVVALAPSPLRQVAWLAMPSGLIRAPVLVIDPAIYLAAFDVAQPRAAARAARPSPERRST